MDKLKGIWKKQEEFNSNFLEGVSKIDKKQEYTKEMILHLISESDEVLREINWKFHRKGDKSIEREKLKEEIIDVFKYWLTIAQIWDITPEEFIEEFYRKSSVVEQRYKQEKQLDLVRDRAVVCVDIDGVLADYPNSFIRYIENETGVDLSKHVLEEYNLYYAISSLIPGGEVKMRELKHEFRATGKEAGKGWNLGVISGAKEGLDYLKKHDYTVVLLSSRPYKKYTRLFADTIEWLNDNSLQYDALLWDENKEERMMKEFPNIVAMIEDCGENAMKVAMRGKRVILMNKTYNQTTEHPNIKRVIGWNEIIDGKLL